MTISNQVSSVTAEGNGSTTSFTYTFLIPTTASCQVQVTDATTTESTTTTLASSQFSVTGIGVTTGGVVTYPLSGSPLSSGFFLTVSRVLPIIQNRSIANQGNFYPAVVEGGLDYLTMICQQLQTEISAIDTSGGGSGGGGTSNPTNVVGTISDMLAMTVTAGTTVFVQGYNAASDGGGGEFYITSSSPGTQNLGTFFDLNTAGLYAVRQTVANMVSPEMFGAYGDGATDDTTALQNFATYVSATGGLGVFTPQAIYIKRQRPVFHGSGFTLEGNGATIRTVAGATASITNATAYFSGSSNFTVRNLIFDGNRDNRTPDLTTAQNIVLTSVSNFTFDNCQGINGATDNWYLSASDQTDVSTFPVNGTFLNCRGYNGYRNNMSIINAFAIDIVGGSFTDANGTAPEAGIDIEANGDLVTTSNYAVKIIGTYFKGNNLNQLIIAHDGHPKAIYVSDCTFDGAGSKQGGFYCTVDDVFVDNCFFKDFSGISSSGNFPMYYPTAGQRLNVKGCTFQNITGSYEQTVVNTRDPVGFITDCTFDGCGMTRAIVVGSSSSLRMTNMTFISTGITSSQGYAYGIVNLAGNCFAADMTFSGCFGCHIITTTTSSSASIRDIFVTSGNVANAGSAVVGILELNGGDFIDNIMITAPDAPNATTSVGIHVLGTPRYFGDVKVSGFSASMNVVFSDAKYPQVSTGSSFTCSPLTNVVMYTGAGGSTITLAPSTSFTDRTSPRVVIGHFGTTGSITIAASSGDTVTGTVTLNTTSVTSSAYMLDVIGKKWYAIT